MSLQPQDNRTALFPLNSVLFPGCRLRLQIFEQRYLRLVKSCLRDNQGFVVVLISHGREVNDTPETYSIGTYVEIVDWEMLENGLFGITIEARYRVRVSAPCARDDGLLMGDAEALQVPPEAEHSGAIEDLVDTLRHLQQHPWLEQQNLQIDFDSAADVCNKLAQVLPVDELSKQSLLEMNATAEKIERLRDILKRIQE